MGNSGLSKKKKILQWPRSGRHRRLLSYVQILAERGHSWTVTTTDFFKWWIIKKAWEKTTAHMLSEKNKSIILHANLKKCNRELVVKWSSGSAWDVTTFQVRSIYHAKLSHIFLVTYTNMDYCISAHLNTRERVYPWAAPPTRRLDLCF